MNLFDSIGLKADPFSTSPNVELFYPAVEHRQCLEGLELAIRMRSGLSVIRGGIGVGKTTISRKLIQNFKAESDDFDFYLILDPKFESEIILLKHIIELFGVNDTAESVQECRNIIENYLQKVGVEQGKTLVLIIDEGQNLPGEMLDVFRTLLNFETDDFKLLQLIIFGQPEMGTMINKYPNFEDRISFDFEIGPIALEDMKGMIDHRIEVTGGNAGDWFSEKTILKIYKNTQGYPRKVTQLCHQLLLTMMSEEKNEINEEMVQRVISGKIDTGGLLKQKKKNYNQIAVNKLLDVLRKDRPEKEQDKSEPLGVDDDDDDWIGDGKIPVEQVPVETVQVDNLPPAPQVEPEEEIIAPVIEDESAGSTNKEIGNNKIPIPSVNAVSDDEFLPQPGKYHPNVNASFLNKIPIDQTVLGVHIDAGRISTTVIQENKGIKSLLAADLYSANNRHLDSAETPSDFSDACQEAMERLDDKLLDYDDLYKSASRSVSKRDAIALTIEHDRMLLKLVQVPKENKKEKQQVIEWAIKKDLPFPVDDAILNYVAGNNNIYHVGVGEKNILEDTADLLTELGWEIRSWYPVAQAIYNAFIWSYPEHRKKNTLIIHLGEENSTILGCVKGRLIIVRPLYIGVQSLTEALRDNGLPIDKWYARDAYKVSESFLRAMGQKVNPGEHDDIFRPVFDSWRQEIDRTINGMRKEFKISDDTEILLSGSAGDIVYLDKFIEGSLGLSTQFLNPLRNLALPAGFDHGSFEYHPTLLTAAIGSALHIDKSANVLPDKLKQDEILRWVNRAGLLVSAATLIICFGVSLSTKLIINSLHSEIEPIQQENNELSYVEQEHVSLSENKINVEQQLDILSYDTEYFNHILAISKFLSYYTPKEIRIDELNFQEGWETRGYKQVGRDIVKVVSKEDEHLRIVRLAGNLHSNSVLLDDHFNNFISTLEESGLFQNIQVIKQASNVGLGKDNLQFLLKCII